MIQYEVTVKNADEVIRRLEQFPQISSAELTTAMQNSVALMVREAKIEAPVNTGRLRSAIGGEVRTEISGEVTGLVAARTEYAAAVEFGQRPHMPPMEAIRYWAMRKFGVGGFESYRVAMMIALKIAKRGVKGKFYMKNAYARTKEQITKQFEAAVERIANKLGDPK